MFAFNLHASVIGFFFGGEGGDGGGGVLQVQEPEVSHEHHPPACLIPFGGLYFVFSEPPLTFFTEIKM